MANPVAWFEIAGPDAATLQTFYRQVFDWQIDADNDMNYGMGAASEGGIAGGVAPSPDGSAHATFYVTVDDVQGTLDKINQIGGKTAMPPMDVPNGPTIAFFVDPAGNTVGLMKGM